MWARPAAPAVCLAAYGIFALLKPETNAFRILPVLGLSVLAGLAYAGTARRIGPEPVLRALLVVDTLLLAGMTAALGRPDQLAIAYFWSIGIAAFFFGARETLATTVLATLCASVVPYLGDFGSDAVVVFTDAVVLALIGGLLAVLSDRRSHAEEALRVESELDAAALRIAGQVRSTLEVDAVLDAAVEELGRATGSARALCQLVDEPGKLHQWTRPGVSPVETPSLAATVLQVVEKRAPLLIEARTDDLPSSLLEYLTRVGTSSVAAVPIFWHGEVIGVLGLHDDRPRRWGAEVQLIERVAPQVGAAIAQAAAFEHERRVARLREQLIANVSHELRTPLTSTIGFLQTLERDDLELDEEERTTFLRIAREQAERLAALVGDLLTLARVQGQAGSGGALAVVRAAVDLAARELPFGNGRPLDVDVADELRARIDERRLVQIVSNLLGNALAHGAGRVRVEGRRDADQVELVVADEGQPIPADLHDEIFVPFARWNESAVGTGLGLPISRSLAEANGGSVVYDGSAFVLRLPAA